MASGGDIPPIPHLPFASLSARGRDGSPSSVFCAGSSITPSVLLLPLSITALISLIASSSTLSTRTKTTSPSLKVL
ncbi:hypothetical protein EJ08DRAFT_652489 [Tothia fuscella]|uniref:Uncharacterized protein n=1 Tax=Tothia fuscella TaxID=1048955 RepID=A0A9P4TU71_9PEZI|nr:hypothetical protein EJ08DRAFT_652489 [Tothia fuscella]